MDINVRIHGNAAHLILSGRFDFKMHQIFIDAYQPILDDPALREIEIEMDKLDYMDSSSLGMLMMLDERARAVNKSIVMLRVTGPVSRLLDVAHFGKLFNIRSTT